MNPEIFVELSKILVITVIITGIIRIPRQPAIIGYILSGIIVGPFVFNVIDSTDVFTTFSQIGVALLLFFVGINLNPKVIRDVGRVSLITGLGQVVFTTGVGFGIAKLIGFSTISSIYVAVALAFSSTIIIMKLLSDKRELDSLHGRISMGFLIVQDFVAIGLLLVISSINNGSNLASLAVDSLLKGIGAIILLFALTKYVLPALTRIVAKSQEFLLLFSITWCFAVASIFYYLNFSIEAGALLAGMSLSMSPYHYEISSKLKSLRDFFLILFFIMLGSQMVFANLLSSLWIIIVLSLFVLIGNPLIVMTLMGLLGYTKRNSFLAGLTVAQISEFSLIVVAMGVTVGHVSNDILSIVTAIGLITFTGSTYMILYSNKLYNLLSGYLSIFEKKGEKVDQVDSKIKSSHEIILVGYNRIGFDILGSLKKIKKKFLIIDYNPEIINDMSSKGYDCKYGDISNYEFLNELNFKKTKMIISTIPSLETNLLLIRKVRKSSKKCIIAVVSHQIDEAVKLYDEGASYVLMPHFLGGKHFSTMIEENKFDVDKFLKEKIAHIEHLDMRKKAGHDHPRYERK